MKWGLKKGCHTLPETIMTTMCHLARPINATKASQSNRDVLLSRANATRPLSLNLAHPYRSGFPTLLLVQCNF